MGDKSKIEESDESHLIWKDGPKQSGAEGQAACVSCAFEAQARSPSQDDHDAHVHIHLHQSLNLRQDLEERKSPHNPPSHLRQRKTSEPVRQAGFASRLLPAQTCQSPPATQSWGNRCSRRASGGVGENKLERRPLAFFGKVSPSPRTFAALLKP